MAAHFVPSDQVAQIRRRLTHPVIDADGHLAEFMPMVIDCMREVADDAVAERFIRFRRSPFTSGEGYLPTRVFFGSPPTLDRMTVMLPKLLYRRLEEIGLDFALLYPTSGLSVLSNPDDELRQAAARALNTYYAQGLRRAPRPARARRGHPDVQPRRGGGRARLRRRHPRPQGSGDERDGAAHGSPRRLGRVVGRHARPRQPPRLRPAVGDAAWSSAWCRPSTASATGGGAGCRRRTTSTTTWATSPPRRRRRAAR